MSRTPGVRNRRPVVPRARRVTVYPAPDGWRYRVQGGNWRTIAASEEGRTSKTRLLDRLRREYAGVELVVK